MLIATAVQRIQKRLRMAQSVAVDVYAEDPLIESIQSAFDFYWNELWWPKFRKFVTVTLDGTTGKPVTVPSDLVDFDAIRNIWPPDAREQTLPRMPETIRPSLIPPGDRPTMFAPSSDNKVFFVLPVSATGTVDVLYYPKPANFTISSSVDFDETLLVLNGTLRYLAGNSANPSETALVQEELSLYWKAYRNRVFDDDVPLRNDRSIYPTEWW
jgi:hypothetical protein